MDERDGHRHRHDDDQDQKAKITVEVQHRIDLHIHDARAGSPAILQDILKGLGVLKQQGVTIMGKVDEQRVALERANVATNEIAADVRELIAKAAEGGLTQEDVDKGNALAAKLEEVAAAYTADPTTPPAEGGNV